MKPQKKTFLFAALLLEPLLLQAATPLIQFQFAEASAPLTNTGSLSATASVVGALGGPGVSGLGSDFSFNNTGAFGMGSMGTTGSVNVSVSALTGTAKKSMTIQGWFKSDAPIANGARLLDNYNASTTKGFSLRGPSSGENAGALYFMIDGQTVNSGVNTYNDTGAWVFFAVTYDYSNSGATGKVKFYKGSFTSPVALVGTAKDFTVNVQSVDMTTSPNLCIGNSSNRPYDGYLDNIRVYAEPDGSATPGAGALTLGQLEVLRQGDLADGAHTVAVTVNAGSLIRSDISRKTFGGGVEMLNEKFRDVINGTGANAATRTSFQNANFGLFRFPSGTTGQSYYWRNPPASYIDHGDPTATPPRPDPHPGLTGSMLLTQDHIFKFTRDAGSLDMELLFELNTFSYVVNDWTELKVNSNGSNHGVAASINTTNLQGAADYAAWWLTNNAQTQINNGNPQRRVTYWEIGNEDWDWWSATQYAKIAHVFASTMKAEETRLGSTPPIKLLAQTLTTTHPAAGGIVNTDGWTRQMVTEMIAQGWPTSNIYGLSEHEYLNGNAVNYIVNGTTIARDFSNYDSDPEIQRFMQSGNMFAKIQANLRVNFLKSEIASLGLNWKIWMTEFNIIQNDATTTTANPNGIMKMLQDLGHGLVIADWTGKMLESGVERLIYHSFDHHPYFSVIDYLNSGGTVSAPIKTVPGYAFEVYAKEFGNKMVQNAIVGNPSLPSPNEGNYDQVSVYSSIRDSDNTLRLIVVNRSATDGIRLDLSCSGHTIATGGAQYIRQELYSPNLTDHNRYNIDHVKWSTPVSQTVPGSTIPNVVLKEHSVNLFIIPLVP